MNEKILSVKSIEKAQKADGTIMKINDTVIHDVIGLGKISKILEEIVIYKGIKVKHIVAKVNFMNKDLLCSLEYIKLV